MTGGGQWVTLQFNNSGGVPHAGVKLFHYAAGTTTLKNIFLDEPKATAATQPLTGDSLGRITFYADGDYRLKVTTADDIQLYDWDNVHLTADRATLWEGDRGTTYPAASTANQGHLYALLDGSSNILDLGINDTGTAFTAIPATAKASTTAGLPTAGTTGRLRWVTDFLKGLWHDTGTQWVATNGGIYNVKDYGAKGDGSTDDTVPINNALYECYTAGGGTVLMPDGTYIVTQLLIGTDTHFKGSGAGTTLKCTSTSNVDGMLLNVDQTAGNSGITVTDMTFERTVQQHSAYNSLLKLKFCENVVIERCKFIRTSFNTTTATLSSANNRMISLWECIRFRVLNNTFKDPEESAIYLDYTDEGSPLDQAGPGRIVAFNTIINFNGTPCRGIVNNQAGVLILGNTLHFAPTPGTTRTVVGIASCRTSTPTTDVNILGNTLTGGGITVHGGSDTMVHDNHLNCSVSGYGGIIVNQSMAALLRTSIQNNTLNGAGGIQVTKTGTNGFLMATVKNNFIANHVGSDYGSIYCAGSIGGLVVEGNTVDTSANTGIYISVTVETILKNNTVKEAGQNPVDSEQYRTSGFFLDRTTRLECRDNVAHDCAGYGFHWKSPNTLNNFVGNTYWDNGGASVLSDVLHESPGGTVTTPFRYWEAVGQLFVPSPAIGTNSYAVTSRDGDALSGLNTPAIGASAPYGYAGSKFTFTGNNSSEASRVLWFKATNSANTNWYRHTGVSDGNGS